MHVTKIDEKKRSHELKENLERYMEGLKGGKRIGKSCIYIIISMKARFLK